MRLNLSLIMVLAWPMFSSSVHAHEHTHDMPMPDRLGSVSFEISCRPQVRADFNRGVGLLHSFWYDEAERAFEKVAAADPGCAIAFWGEAMAGFSQINGWPEASQVTSYPDDLEAKVFYALALLASDSPDDVDLANPRKAVAILYPLFREHPDHPGIAHYIIHACDNPQMAKEGLEAARRYAKIAPASPHALHMPGHIFARLGLWQDDIHSNLASKLAAESTTGMHVGAENRLHAMEFLEYAYLQTGQDNNARSITAEATTVKQSDVDPRYPDYYSMVEERYPALFAIETHDWMVAAHLKPAEGAPAVSHLSTLLAHAMAAGYMHDRRAARDAARAMDALMVTLVGNNKGAVPPWRATPRDEVYAWADFARGDLRSAIALLRPIADRQAKSGKEEVELPAREMLADMLLLSGKPGDALDEYQTSLLSDPNRFNALLGAGRAAEQKGQHALAVGYYRTLLANCTEATGWAVKALAHARSVINAWSPG
jgi:tetratricopeptide (TPR) repeat protein